MDSMLHSWQSDPLKDWCNILEYRGSFAVEYFLKIAKVSQNTYVQISLSLSIYIYKCISKIYRNNTECLKQILKLPKSYQYPQ